MPKINRAFFPVAEREAREFLKLHGYMPMHVFRSFVNAVYRSEYAGASDNRERIELATSHAESLIEKLFFHNAFFLDEETQMLTSTTLSSVRTDNLYFTYEDLTAMWFQIFMRFSLPSMRLKFIRPPEQSEYEHLLYLYDNVVFSITALPWPETDENFAEKSYQIMRKESTARTYRAGSEQKNSYIHGCTDDLQNIYLFKDLKVFDAFLENVRAMHPNFEFKNGQKYAVMMSESVDGEIYIPEFYIGDSIKKGLFSEQ